MEFYLKIYTSDHEIIDEIYELTDLDYTFSINGIGKANISVPYYAKKTKQKTYKISNDIEIWRKVKKKKIKRIKLEDKISYTPLKDIIDEPLFDIDNELIFAIDEKVTNGFRIIEISYYDEELLWWGVIYNTIPEGSNFKIECSGYAAKIENRLFNQYINDEFKIYRGTYDKVLFSMLKDINSYYYTGINQGDAQYISLDTERKIEWNDNFYEKLNDFTTDSNYYWDIDNNRKLNLYSSIGEDKTYYEINDEVNVIDTLSINTSGEIYNHIIAKNTYTEEESDVEVTLISEKKNQDSINLYGLRTKELSVNDIHIQETLDNYVQRELDKCSDPILNIVIEVSNSGIFDIFNIKKGDLVTLNLSCLKLSSKIKIIEYTIHPKTLTATITLGNCYFRPNRPNMYRF